MINYIIILLAGAAFLLSIITVLPERLLGRNTVTGRLLRAMRIRLRELSFTSFCVSSIILLLWGLIIHDKCYKSILLFIGILFLTLIVLHPEYIFVHFRSKRKARRKAELPLCGRTPLYKRRTPKAARLSENKL